MFDDFEDTLIRLLFLVIFSLLIVIIGMTIYDLISDKKCKIYSELKTKSGVMLVGKAVIPTTYQGRDCLVWENKE